MFDAAKRVRIEGVYLAYNAGLLDRRPLALNSGVSSGNVSGLSSVSLGMTLRNTLE
jgi:hypothetical protein